MCVFFFQAEDGIRDLTVTGVQTCALPICAGMVLPLLLPVPQVHGGARLGADRHVGAPRRLHRAAAGDRKSTRLNSSHSQISYAVFCLKKKKKKIQIINYNEDIE